MATAFTPILKGEVSCHRILEDEAHLAFLEPNPVASGHVVVLPKKETDHFFDLEDSELAALVLFAKKVAQAMRKAIPCEKIAVQIYGIKVRHAHVHLIPVMGVPGELNLANAAPADEAELETIAEEIREAL